MKKLFTGLFLIFAAAVWAGDREDADAALRKDDFTTAAILYKKVAEQGDRLAQYNLGMIYSLGEGVLQDYAEAVRWFKLAAKQGDSDAQYELANSYYSGEGVLQDYVKAHMWMNISAASGDKYARKERNAFNKKMTSQQIAKAQEMAKRCLTSKYKDCD